MKRTALLLTLLTLALAAGSAFAQPWMAQFDNWDRQPTTLEIIDAFDAYWDGKEPTKGSGYKQFMRWRHFVEFRLDETGQFNPGSQWNAWEEKQALFPANELDESDWYPLGPFDPISGSYVGGLGRVNCLAQDPSNPLVMYAGGASGGVWKTFVGGYNWIPLTDDLPVLGVGHIEIDPNNTDVLYVATGDPDGQDTYSIGVIKSTDGGTTWDLTGLSYDVTEGRRISKVLIKDDDSSTLIAATSQGIHKSTDAGDTWTLVSPANGFPHDLEKHPTNPDIFYAAMSGNGVYRSTDGGDSWARLGNGLPNQGGSVGRIAIDLTQDNPDVVHALYSNTSNGFYGFYRSTDGGDSWSLMSDSPNILSNSISGGGSGGQAWYDLTLDTDPEDANTIYVGGVNVWKSVDGGNSWDITGVWYYTGGVPYVHADHHRMEWFVDENDNYVLYNANDGGVYRTTNGGDYWEEISHGMVIQQSYRFGVFQNSPEVEKIIFGNQDNGTKLKDGDDFIAVLGGDGFESAIDPVNYNYMYGEVYYGSMSRSTNGGQSWNDANTGIQEQGAWLTPFVIDPNNPSVLWKGTSYIYRSTNRAQSWSRFNDSGAGGSYYDNMTAMAVAPGNSDVVYGVNPNSDLVYTRDGGVTWEFNDVPGAYPSSPSSYVAVHPFNDAIVYVTSGGYTDGQKVHVSYDRGNTWDNISDGLPNVPANCIAIHPLDPQHVYLGTDIGVFFSDDGGLTWQDWSTNLPNVIISELELHLNSNTMVAASYGRGIWASPAEEVDADPFLNVSAPNGGEEWTIGSDQTIRWTSYGIDDDVRIEINRNYPNGPWETLFAATPNDWTQEWTVDGPETGNARIRITSLATPDINDMSDGDFATVTPNITIVQPNGGEVLPTDIPYDIQWTTTAISGNLGLDLNLDYPGGTWITLVEGIPDMGELAFTPNQSMITDNARFRLRSLELPVEDISDGDFSIEFIPMLELTSLDTDGQLFYGDELTISWEDNIGDPILVEFIDDQDVAVSVDTLTSSGTGADSDEIVVAGDIVPGEMYTIRLSSLADASINATSEGVFSIELAIPTLTSPADGELINGDPAVFSWEPVPGADSYTWLLATSPDMVNDVIETVSGIADASYQTDLTENGTWYWSVQAEGGVAYTGEAAAAFSFDVDITSVAELDQFSGVPQEYELAGIYPNPFNPDTRIVVALPAASELTVKVYNTEGRLVQTLSNGLQPAGYQMLSFGNETLASGAYFVSINVPGKLDVTRKIMLVR